MWLRLRNSNQLSVKDTPVERAKGCPLSEVAVSINSVCLNNLSFRARGSGLSYLFQSPE